MAKTSTAKKIILGFASLMLMKVSRNVTNDTFQSDKLQMTESSASLGTPVHGHYSIP